MNYPGNINATEILEVYCYQILHRINLLNIFAVLIDLRLTQTHTEDMYTTVSKDTYCAKNLQIY